MVIAVLRKNKAFGVVESGLERQRDVFGEKDFWPRAKRDPLVPVVLRIPVFAALVDENWHDGELLVRLKEHLFYGQKPGRAMEKRRWIIDRGTEVACCSGSVLNGKRVIPTVPLQALMAQPEGVSIGCRNGCARWRLATF